MTTRHRFSREELDAYLDRICLPQDKRVYDVKSLSDEQKLTYINLLQKHHLCKVPWENLAQHYSFHRTILVKPKFLFRKIITNPGRGGYCMEVNYFFHLILFSLGFDVYMAGARIYNPESRTYGGWTHVVNLVEILGQRYLLDGGMGPNGPSHPLLVRDGEVYTQIAPAQMRVTHEAIPQQLDQRQKVWIYSYRYNDSRDWTPAYCFVDLEFTPEDIQSMNFAPWLNKHSFFTHKVVCVRFSTSREVDGPDKPGSPGEAEMEGELDGTMSMNHDVFRWRRKGVLLEEIRFQDEKQRVDTLRKYFGIHLTEEDQESILGTGSQIGSGVAAKG